MTDSLDFIESFEALAWLEQKDGIWRNVGDSSERLTPEDTLRIVQELYEAGATEVLALGIELLDEIESGSGLRVVLPCDPAARARVFEVQARVVRETGSPFEPDLDKGQAMITLGW